MKFKERIEIKSNLSAGVNSNKISLKEDSDSIDLFVKNDETFKIVSDLFKRNSNIILLSQSNIDRIVLLNYFRLFIKSDTPVELVNNLSEEIYYSTAKKIIVPEPTVDDFIKILELILCDFRTFIFSMNVKSFKNIVDTFRVLISLNRPNLISQNIEHLICMSSCALIMFEVNEEGLLYISNISELSYQSNKTVLKEIYVENLIKNSTENVEEQIDTKQEEIPVDNQEEIKNIVEIFDDVVPPADNQKVNKYKLLKEKVKRKKQ